MEKRKYGQNVWRQMLAYVLAVVMIVGMLPATAVRAEETRFNFLVHSASETQTGGEVYYKLGDAAEWNAFSEMEASQDGNHWIPDTISTGTVVNIKAVVSEGYELDNASVGIRGNGTGLSTDELTALKSEQGFSYKIPEAGEYEFEIRFCSQNSGGGDNPQPPTVKDLKVTIGADVVYDAGNEEGPKISVPENAVYNVEEIKRQDGTVDGVAIKPNPGTDKNHNPEEDINKKTGITLAPIVAEGSGRVEVHAGLNYTPEGVTDGSHIEEDVPITIQASDSGYSFEATDDAEFVICWGNFRSTATLRGGVKARSFTVNDVKELTIVSENSLPVAQAFCAPLRDNGGQQVVYENSAVEFNLAKVNINAQKAFVNYKEIRAWDEADVTVTVSANELLPEPESAAKVFENVGSMQVQTGGKFTLQSDSAIEYPDQFKVEAGYYTEIGEILPIEKTEDFRIRSIWFPAR